MQQVSLHLLHYQDRLKLYRSHVAPQNQRPNERCFHGVITHPCHWLCRVTEVPATVWYAAWKRLISHRSRRPSSPPPLITRTRLLYDTRQDRLQHNTAHALGFDTWILPLDQNNFIKCPFFPQLKVLQGSEASDVPTSMVRSKTTSSAARRASSYVD